MTLDRIKEILEGCEGVTPGPWYRDSVQNEDDEGKFTSFSLHSDEGVIADTLNSGLASLKEEQDLTEDGVFYDLVDIVGVQNIDHLSRLDPDTVRQLCLLALKGLEAHQPRDIATAPRDGTEIRAFREDAGWMVAKYGACDMFPLSDSEAEEIPEDSYWQQDWWAYTFDGVQRLEAQETPTHWMPLPSPPIQEQS